MSKQRTQNQNKNKTSENKLLLGNTAAERDLDVSDRGTDRENNVFKKGSVCYKATCQHSSGNNTQPNTALKIVVFSGQMVLHV